MTELARVYIIDDEAAVLNSMSFLLEVYELSVRCFTSAEEFLLAAPSLEPGCVLCDVRMPGIGGIELLENLGERRPYFPVVVMTGFGDADLTKRVLDAGAIDYIKKPSPGSVIIDAVLSALQSIDALPDYALPSSQAAPPARPEAPAT